MARFSFLDFQPVPVRPRRGGWTPTLQRRFVIGIAFGLSPAQAAARLGRTRQSAFNLRRRSGGQGFADAWDAARIHALEARAGRLEREDEFSD